MKLGDTVIVEFNDGRAFNGSTIAPAIVTRIWDPNCVNVQVIPDNDEPFIETSVMRLKSGEDFSSSLMFYEVDSEVAKERRPSEIAV